MRQSLPFSRQSSQAIGWRRTLRTAMAIRHGEPRWTGAWRRALKTSARLMCTARTASLMHRLVAAVSAALAMINGLRTPATARTAGSRQASGAATRATLAKVTTRLQAALTGIRAGGRTDSGWLMRATSTGCSAAAAAPTLFGLTTRATSRGPARRGARVLTTASIKAWSSARTRSTALTAARHRHSAAQSPVISGLRRATEATCGCRLACGPAPPPTPASATTRSPTASTAIRPGGWTATATAS